MALAAIIIPIAYNLEIQLRPEQLAQARQRWQEHGIPDYDLDYMVRIDRDPIADEYRVKVRGGKVVAVIGNRDVLLVDERAGLLFGPAIRALHTEGFQQHRVEGLFQQIEADFQHDVQPGQRRNYVTASFDARDGHPVRYIRRVAGTSERLEWIIKLTRVK